MFVCLSSFFFLLSLIIVVVVLLLIRCLRIFWSTLYLAQPPFPHVFQLLLLFLFLLILLWFFSLNLKWFPAICYFFNFYFKSIFIIQNRKIRGSRIMKRFILFSILKNCFNFNLLLFSSLVFLIFNITCFRKNFMGWNCIINKC